MNGWRRLWVVLTVLWALGAGALFVALMGPFGLVVAAIPPALLWGIAWVVAGFRGQ